MDRLPSGFLSSIRKKTTQWIELAGFRAQYIPSHETFQKLLDGVGVAALGPNQIRPLPGNKP